MTAPTYSDVQHTLDNLELDKYACEIHGSLCGLLCTAGNTSAQPWLDTIVPQPDTDNLLHREALKLLTDLHHSTVSQLNDPTCDFHLLMPDDDTDFGERVTALSDWCQSFLLGLSLGGLQDLKKLPPDAIEVATDLTEIARAGTSYELEGTEEDEEAFQELIEFVRVGILLIYEELHPDKSTPGSTSDPGTILH